MARFDIPDHPEIAWAERTGYPSWMQDDDFIDEDEDSENEFWGDEQVDLYD